MEPAIVTNELTRRFGDTVAVDHLSMEVNQGEVFGFLGHNGAGKTTTVRLLNGVLNPSGGSAEILGLSPIEQGVLLRRRTGVLTETPSLEERLTARENLEIYADLYDVPLDEVSPWVNHLLDFFELADKATEKVAGYSKGMKQRLALARSLINKPDILFLDEPTSGLDPVTSRRVHELIIQMSQSQGHTVFLCTHDLAEAQKLCHRVGVMRNGRLLALGTPAELAQKYVHSLNVELEIDPDSLPTTLDLLRNWRGVDFTSRPDSHLTLQGIERADIPILLEKLVDQGVKVYKINPQEASLEDVYFALEGKMETQQGIYQPRNKEMEVAA